MSESCLKPIIPFPALLIDEEPERILVVADLHIGWEINLVERGIHIPSQISRIQAKLLTVIEECKPERVVILGDIKQTIPRISLEEWRSVPEFLERIQKSVSDVSVILGNHDGNLEPLTPRSVKIVSSQGMTIGRGGRIGLFHGHAWPSPRVLGCEVLVMGHIHPVLRFRDRLGYWTVTQVWVKAKCDSRRLVRAYLKYLNVKVDSEPQKAFKERFGVELREPKLIVMPAFNDLVGGASVNRFDRRVIGPLLSSGSVIMDEAELHLLDWTYLGTLGQIREHPSLSS